MFKVKQKNVIDVVIELAVDIEPAGMCLKKTFLIIFHVGGN